VHFTYKYAIQRYPWYYDSLGRTNGIVLKRFDCSISTVRLIWLNQPLSHDFAGGRPVRSAACRYYLSQVPQTLGKESTAPLCSTYTAFIQPTSRAKSISLRGSEGKWACFAPLHFIISLCFLLRTLLTKCHNYLERSLRSWWTWHGP